MSKTITSLRADPADLLVWYDRHARDLPWRVSPSDRARGIVPDPYRVWLSEIMLQQTTVAAVIDYFLAFTKRWPDVHTLSSAPSEDVLAAWAGLGYYTRARNLIKCAGVVSRDLGGVFPRTGPELEALPGIGRYTAGAIRAIAFDQPATVVDGNVERVMARLMAHEEPLPKAKKPLTRFAEDLTPDHRPGDYAQAVMDLGATICTPRKPACALCPWRDACRGHALGIAETLPRKLKKPKKPIRRGIAWVMTDGRTLLTARRPDRGLLGGMLAVPTTDWAEAVPEPTPPFPADWRAVGEVRHTFTHFHLRLDVHLAAQEPEGPAAMAIDEAVAAMPTVFEKACRMALAACVGV